MAGNREGSSIDSQMRPDAKVVNEFHSNDDVDKDSNAHHHTLGGGSNQASPGAHRHDGTDSVSLLEGIEIAGSKGGNLALGSVIQALVVLGATDNTTA
jgi:hypothetical protein